MGYCDFFHFATNPFGETPNTKFFYASAQHSYALNSILKGIEDGKGFQMLVGEVGVGKSILARLLANKVSNNSEVALILNPLVKDEELMEMICAEFCIEIGSEQTMSAKLNALNSFLLSNAKLGRRALLIIDEAQCLSKSSLELIRLLTNFETESEKLLQILLVAQPEIDLTLEDFDLRQLKQRIYQRSRLAPLSESETALYIRHRISCAGGENLVRFDDRAIKLIHEYTNGVPRLINKLAEIILLRAEGANLRNIEAKFVRGILGINNFESRIKETFSKLRRAL